jgi:hypothetical protein
MSSKDVDPAKRRGWLRRNWLWFIPTLLLALIVLGAGVGYWWLFVRVYRLDVCRAAMQTIQNDKELQEKLGQPIGVVWWPSRSAAPSARIEEREKDVLWSIEGPKGRAKVRLLAQMRVGQWQTVILDVTLPDGEKVSPKEAGDNEGDAPPFQAPKPAGKTPESKAPPEINLPVPPADAPG